MDSEGTKPKGQEEVRNMQTQYVITKLSKLIFIPMCSNMYIIFIPMCSNMYIIYIPVCNNMYIIYIPVCIYKLVNVNANTCMYLLSSSKLSVLWSSPVYWVWLEGAGIC